MVFTTAVSTPMIDRPWLITPITNAPITAPGMVPIPPVTAVPPMKQSAGADQPVQQRTTLSTVIVAEEHVDDMTFIYSL